MIVELEYILCYGLLVQWYKVLLLWIVIISGEAPFLHGRVRERMFTLEYMHLHN